MHDPRGERYGMLEVLGFTGRRYVNRDRFCLAQCDCGNVKEMNYAVLKRANGSRSCGCRQGDYKHGHARRSGKSPEYSTWSAMWARCTNPDDPNYPEYGGRGIKVCARWRKFENFLADMGPCNGMIIDRARNEKGYYKANCRWVTRTESNHNIKSNKVILVNGRTYCLAELVREFGTAPYRVALWRYMKGWEVARAIGAKDPTIIFQRRK